jgi:hypothetical protein
MSTRCACHPDSRGTVHGEDAPRRERGDSDGEGGIPQAGIVLPTGHPYLVDVLRNFSLGWVAAEHRHIVVGAHFHGAGPHAMYSVTEFLALDMHESRATAEIAYETLRQEYLLAMEVHNTWTVSSSESSTPPEIMLCEPHINDSDNSDDV